MDTNSPNKTTVPRLGYLRHSFTQKNLIDARNVKVEKKNAGIAWGAVYAGICISFCFDNSGSIFLFDKVSRNEILQILFKLYDFNIWDCCF